MRSEHRGASGATFGGSLGVVVAVIASTGDTSLWCEWWFLGLFGLVVAVTLASGYALLSTYIALPMPPTLAERQARAADEAATRASAPVLSFGRAELPRHWLPISILELPGKERIVPGRIVRVPVTNAQGAGEARHVHVRLDFGHLTRSGFAPSPAQGEWSRETGPEVEIDIPGNGRPYLIDVVVILKWDYPHIYEWTARSRSSPLLAGYEVKSNHVEIRIEVLSGGAGPAVARLDRTLRIRCDSGHIISADWIDRVDDEGSNLVPWN